MDQPVLSLSWSGTPVSAGRAGRRDAPARRHRPVRSLLAASLLCTAACGSSPEAIPASSEPTTPAGRLVLGMISPQPVSKIRKYQPLTHYLASRLGSFEIGIGEVRVAKKVDTLAQWMRRGEVDLFIDSFYPATSLQDRTGAELILLSARSTGQKSSTIFARADSGLRQLADLKGRVIAIEEPDSTTGFMLPISHLIAAGIEVTESPGPDAPVAPDEVGYIFSLDDDNTLLWVLSGKAVAGAADSRTFRHYSERSPGVLLELATTASLIRHHLVLTRPGIDDALGEAIAVLLLGLPNSEQGRALLDSLGIVGFLPITEDSQAALAAARRLYDRLPGPLMQN